MKKILLVAVAAMVGLTIISSSVQAADSRPGGFQGFLSGCCFGLRTGADYNDEGTGDRDFLPWFLVGVCIGPRTAQDYVAGKDIHFRDWCRIIPYVNVVFAVWDGIDTSNGKGRAELQQAYGSNYY